MRANRHLCPPPAPLPTHLQGCPIAHAVRDPPFRRHDRCRRVGLRSTPAPSPAVREPRFARRRPVSRRRRPHTIATHRARGTVSSLSRGTAAAPSSSSLGFAARYFATLISALPSRRPPSTDCLRVPFVPLASRLSFFVRFSFTCTRAVSCLDLRRSHTHTHTNTYTIFLVSLSFTFSPLALSFSLSQVARVICRFIVRFSSPKDAFSIRFFYVLPFQLARTPLSATVPCGTPRRVSARPVSRWPRPAFAGASDCEKKAER